MAFNNTGSNIALVSKANQTWASYAQGGSGSIVITTLTTHHAVGTFAFTGVASSGGGTLAVTNGKFDITF